MHFILENNGLRWFKVEIHVWNFQNIKEVDVGHPNLWALPGKVEFWELKMGIWMPFWGGESPQTSFVGRVELELVIYPV